MSATARPSPPARYACTGCGRHWRYRQIRMTARCPACGSGLWALDPEERPSAT